MKLKSALFAAALLCCCVSCNRRRADWTVQEFQDYYHRTHWCHAETNHSCAGEIPGYQTMSRQRAQRALMGQDGLRVFLTELIPARRLKSFKGFRPLRTVEGIGGPVFEEIYAPGDPAHGIVSLSVFADDGIIQVSINPEGIHTAQAMSHDEAISEAIRVFSMAYPQLATQFPPSNEKAQSPVSTIGIYDSRAIAVAFAGSEAHSQSLEDLRRQHEKAKAEGDEERVQQLEAQAQARQDVFHKQGFSTAPVGDILEHIADQLPGIAEKAGVDLILSKWDEAALSEHASAERVDITMLLVEAFDPKEKSLKWAIEIQDHAPISPEELEKHMANGNH